LRLQLQIHRRTSWPAMRVFAQASGGGRLSCAMMAHEPT
jgi:hypothetical protein